METVKEQTHKYSVGDRAKIVMCTYGHQFPIGTIVTIKRLKDATNYLVCDKSGKGWYVAERELSPCTVQSKQTVMSEVKEVKHTPLPKFIRDGRLLYALHQTGWRLGKPVMCNKFSMQVDFDRNNLTESDAEMMAIEVLEACNNYYSLKTDVASYQESFENQSRVIESLREELDKIRQDGANIAEDRERVLDEREALKEEKERLREALKLGLKYTSELSTVYNESTTIPESVKDEITAAIKAITKELKAVSVLHSDNNK